MLASQGDSEGVVKLYYEALRSEAEDVLLWYALGVNLKRLRRWQEAEKAFRYVVRHGEPGSTEARLARIWLDRGAPGDHAGAGKLNSARER